MQGVLFNLGFVNISTEEHSFTRINCFLILYTHKLKKQNKPLHERALGEWM